MIEDMGAGDPRAVPQKVELGGGPDLDRNSDGDKNPKVGAGTTGADVGVIKPAKSIFDLLAVPQSVSKVREFFEHEGINVRFDGSYAYYPQIDPNGLPLVVSLGKLHFAPTDAFIVDEIMFASKAGGIKLSKSDIRAALRKVRREDQIKIFDAIVAPTEAVIKRAEKEWARLGLVFEKNNSLAVAVLKHFIWLVKRKLMDGGVEHHIMPIVTSALQGTGKTTFVRKFLAPLGDLFAEALISDLADSRSGDIYSYPVVFVDDVPTVEGKAVEAFKSVVTGRVLSRRRLGSSRVVNYEQLATFIGTANKSVDDIILDSTGNRRFVSLPFRNGKVAAGGDPEIWPIVDQMDASLLWQSVNADEPAPISSYLVELQALQEAARPRGVVEQWLDSLDIASDAVSEITATKGVKAKPLWKLFVQQTGCDMTNTMFGIQMTRLTTKPNLPFAEKIIVAEGTVYPLKPLK